jgi:hypothetical protein
MNEVTQEHSRSLMQRIPPELRDALEDPARARLVTFAAMSNLNGAPPTGASILDRLLTAAEVAEVRAHCTALSDLGPSQRISIVELAVPALRQLDAAARMKLLAGLKDVALADQTIAPVELLLFTIVRHRLETRTRTDASRQLKLSQVSAALGPTLSLLANHSAASARAAAFEAGAAQLRVDACTLRYIPPERQSTTEITAGFAMLRNLMPLAKEIFLTACVTTVLHDGKVGLEETEVVRTFCAVLDVPFPPVLESSLPQQNSRPV